MIRKMQSLLLRMKWSVAGQALNFAAMFIPVFINRFDALKTSVLVTPYALIGYFFLSFSFPAIFPIQSSARSASVSFVASHILVLATCLAGGVLVPFISPKFGIPIFYIIVLMLGYSVFYISSTFIVRAGDVNSLNSFRLCYGLLNFIATSAFCTCSDAIGTVVFATFFAQAGSAAFLILLWRARIASALQPVPFKVADVLAYQKRHALAALANLASGVSFHAGSLALGVVGGAAATPWAIVARVGGGMATTGQQIVGPQFEIEISRALRDGERSSVNRQQIQALKLGLLIGIAAAILVGCIVILKDSLLNFGREASFVFFASSLAYVVAICSNSASTKNLTMLDGNKLLLSISLFKILLLAILAFATDGWKFLALFSVLEVIYQMTYTGLCLMIGSARAQRR